MSGCVVAAEVLFISDGLTVKCITGLSNEDGPIPEPVDVTVTAALSLYLVYVDLFSFFYALGTFRTLAGYNR